VSPAPALDRRARHTKRCGGLGQGQMRDCLEPLERERASWSTQAFALRPGAFQAGPDALDDAFAFELSHGRQPMELQATGRSAGVDRFAEGHERDVETLELVWSLSKNGRHKDCCFASR